MYHKYDGWIIIKDMQLDAHIVIYIDIGMIDFDLLLLFFKKIIRQDRFLKHNIARAL